MPAFEESANVCGLVGLLSNRAFLVRPGFFDAMCGALTHRGPDDGGVWCDPEFGVALGHRRLSIVDLSPAGAQPMTSADGRRVLVFNGEIYNFRALRAELDQAGVAWRGHSDTEVLLEAIGAWGVEDALRRIEGQFAFALWDRPRRELVLARDRFGEKPLYYGRVGADFVFASELKALRRHPDFRGEIDQAALGAYVRYGYVPHPRSIYRGVRKLPQGCLLRVRGCEAGRAGAPQPYWDIGEAVRAAAAEPFEGSETEATDALDGVLQRSVAARMVADVPLGALLSGGIDSSLTVALMQATSPRPVRTFTIGSWDRRLNEAEHAATVASVLGTEHTELYVGPETALAVIPRLADIYDEPFADSSQIPTFLVSQLARQSVTVALSGDGGDELFGGYNRYFLGQHWSRFARLPGPARAAVVGAVEALSPDGWNALVAGLGPLAPRELRHGRAGDKLHKWADKARAPSQQAFLAKLLSAWSEPETVLARPCAMADLTCAAELEAHGFALGAMYGDTCYYLPDDILVKVDRASMATSLEVRTPFLDRSVFDFAWRLPLALKIRGGHGKHILRRVLARYVPPGMFERPKQGFAVPIADWLRGELRDWAEALLDERRLKAQGLLNPATVRRVWDEHLSGRRNWDTRLWTVLMLQQWLEGEATTASAVPSASQAATARTV
jgi:asparagine synthase (glutamine-hydrolysing)